MAKQNGTTEPQSRGSSDRKRAKGRKRRAGGSQPEPAQQRSQRQSLQRGAVAEAGTKMVDTLRDNPIPAALIGAGLTWLLVRNRQRLPMLHMPDALSGIADTVLDSFSGTAQSTRQAVRGGVGSAAESVKDGAVTLAQYAQSGASQVGQAAKSGYGKGRDAVAETWDEHPLTVGLALLAAGLAAGMMLPAPRGGAITRAAKGLTQRVTSTGEELVENARDLVSSSARAVSREVKRQGLTPKKIGRKVKRIAGALTP